MNDAPVAGLLRSAGIGMLRYPGGSYGDIYHWQTNTAQGGFVAPGNDFDSFMTTARAAAARPIVIANYGTGTPQEAADWVRYANLTRGYGAKYWEIGNEVYGNGFYGAQWEADQHADKSPAAYAANASQYITAMKAVDPTIKVGVVVTTPGFWPDGVVGPGSSADWNHTVLPVLAPKADFVVFHWYPGGSSPADLLTKPSLVAGATSQPAALFAADDTMAMLDSGVSNVSWWNQHNGVGNVTSNPDGSLDYGDQVDASSDQSLVTVHAVRRAGGHLAVLLVNKDPANSYAVSLSYTGFQPAGQPTVFSFANGAHAITSAQQGSATAQTVPPYSLTTLDLAPSGTGETTTTSSPGGSTTTTSTTAPPTTTGPTTTTVPAGGCQVSDRLQTQWQDGFVADVTIRNTGSVAVSGWALAFSFPGDQRVTNMWNAVATQTGQAVSAADAGWNRVIAAGGTAALGFQASYSGSNLSPTSFRLNGTACTLA